MSTISKRMLELLVSEAGPTATEYAVLLAVISITVLGAMAAFGQRVDSIYTAIDGAASGI
ncbi:MAG: Flp family type IVb pilin [Phycisphaerae bacterium]